MPINHWSLVAVESLYQVEILMWDLLCEHFGQIFRRRSLVHELEIGKFDINQSLEADTQILNLIKRQCNLIARLLVQYGRH